MDILVPDNWLRDYLTTKATKKDVQKYLSLSGPSVERILNDKDYPTYAIEVTTNRVDSASVYGIAREASAILPRFNIAAKLLPIKLSHKEKLLKKVKYLDAVVDKGLCPRFTAVLIKNVTVKPSPKYIQERLEAVGVRPINNVVDISNYVMHELGQPMHTFDYDKIKNAKMILRESKKGEKITTLDGQDYVLSAGHIVIEDGSGQIIDLVGIMGGKNSMVDTQTKNVLMFVQTYEPTHIRKTSMQLAKRSEASALFEKGLDPELVETGIRRGIVLFEELTGGVAEKEILDIYSAPYKTKVVKLTKNFIETRLGIKLTPTEITNTLKPLGFEMKWIKDNLEVSVPSYRAKDVSIPEDITEEVARIYGYQNIPNNIMAGELPLQSINTPFRFETNIRNILKGMNGIEIYTLSLVSKAQAGEGALKLKNPLGTETEYLRTQLQPSLESAAKDNVHIKDPFFLYELSNVYLPRKNDLPEERMKLGAIFLGYLYREAKGILEGLLEQLNVNYKFEVKDADAYLPNHRLIIRTKEEIGELGVLKSNYIYFQIDLEKLKDASNEVRGFTPLSKYPPQVEDMTLVLPDMTRVGDIIEEIVDTEFVANSELKDVYENSYTFRIWYHSDEKTLTNAEVEKIREKIINNISKKFGATIKA
jgi:phenylalanyl-tRNA synthetase beta chain